MNASAPHSSKRCNVAVLTRRASFWSIQISRYQRDPSQFDIAQLAKITEGLTGAEIEAVFVDALYRGFAREEEPTDLTIGEALVDFVPLSKLMAEQISGLRQWAKGRARHATTQPAQRTERKIAA